MKIAPTTPSTATTTNMISTIKTDSNNIADSFYETLFSNIDQTSANTNVILNIMFNPVYGNLNPCLTNCSNQGYCSITAEMQLICQCNLYYKGSLYQVIYNSLKGFFQTIFFFEGQSCQTSIKSCSSNPCLNDANCIDINSTSSEFSCECKNNYYGTFCEKRANVCENSTCNNQGYCFFNSSTNNASCKCFLYYSGENCEKTSAIMKYRTVVITLATILAIITIVTFIVFILFMDYLKYFVIKSKPLEKIKQLKILNMRSKIQRFKYKQFEENKINSKWNNMSNEEFPVYFNERSQESASLFEPKNKLAMKIEI